jgi:hypothetical protein
MLIQDYFKAPSMTILLISEIMILIFIYILFTFADDVKKFTTFQKLSILVAFLIGVSSHGLLYAGLEKQYNFNLYDKISKIL